MSAESPGGNPGSSPVNPLGLFAVVWSPVRTQREVAGRRSAVPGFVVVAATAAAGLVLNLIFVLTGITRRRLETAFEQPSPAPGLPPGLLDTLVRVTEIAGPIGALFSPFLGWLVVSLLMQLFTRFFNGTGPLSAMLGVVGVAQIPGLIGVPVQLSLVLLRTVLGPQSTTGVLLGYLASLVGVALFVWYVVLVVIGAAEARNIGYGDAAGSCAISCVGIAIFLVLIGVIVGIGVAITLGAATSR